MYRDNLKIVLFYLNAILLILINCASIQLIINTYFENKYFFKYIDILYLYIIAEFLKFCLFSENRVNKTLSSLELKKLLFKSFKQTLLVNSIILMVVYFKYIY